MFRETKKRSIFKSISWRVVAVINSWTILSLMITNSNFWNAIIMNITGFIFFYIFERAWNNINFGKIEE
jgi:uncharacterized membrane protein